MYVYVIYIDFPKISVEMLGRYFPNYSDNTDLFMMKVRMFFIKFPSRDPNGRLHTFITYINAISEMPQQSNAYILY